MPSEFQKTPNQMAPKPAGHLYAVDEVDWLVDVFRRGGEIPEGELAGMEKLLEVLRHYEFKSEADIEDEARRYFAAKNHR